MPTALLPQSVPRTISSSRRSAWPTNCVAKEEAAALVEDARQRAAKMIDEAKEDARAEGEKLKEAARSEIELEVKSGEGRTSRSGRGTRCRRCTANSRAVRRRAGAQRTARQARRRALSGSATSWQNSRPWLDPTPAQLSKPRAKTVMTVLTAGPACSRSSGGAVADEAVADAIAAPGLTAQGKAQLIVDLIGEELGPKGTNLVRLMAENKRLELAGEVAGQYEDLKDAFLRTLEVEVISAREISGSGSRHAVGEARRALRQADRTHQPYRSEPARRCGDPRGRHGDRRLDSRSPGSPGGHAPGSRLTPDGEARTRDTRTHSRMDRCSN